MTRQGNLSLVFDGNRVLHDGVNLVLMSNNPWPLLDLSELGIWNCKLAGWAIKDDACLVKVIIDVRRSPSFEAMGVVFARLGRLFFEDLDSEGFDVTEMVSSEWFENRHYLSDTDVIYSGVSYVGFFFKDDPKQRSSGSSWMQPAGLAVEFRLIDFDESFGIDDVVQRWDLYESIENWLKVDFAMVSFEKFAQRLLVQSKSCPELRFLDSLVRRG